MRSQSNQKLLCLLLCPFFSTSFLVPPAHLHLHASKVLKCLFSTASDEENSEYKAITMDENDEIDAETLGIWSEEDFKTRTKFEWDEGTDPNDLDPTLEYYTENPVDEDGVEKGWDPLYGPSNPFDERTIVSPVESYMIAESSRNDEMLEQRFPPSDPERGFNDEVTEIRKDLKIIETYVDPFLDIEVPRHVATWHGYHQETKFPKKDFMNNRFTKPEDKTDFTKLDPYRARQKAVEMARSKNCEWLPEGYSEQYKMKKTAGFRRLNVLAGSLKEGDKDPQIVERIRPVMKVLGDAAQLLSIQETVFRFRYYGPMKNRRGIQDWTGKMIRDCGVNCTGVLFETGGRKRDEWE